MQNLDIHYNSGNYQKYLSKNPLKRKMVVNFQEKLMDILLQTISEDSKIADIGCGEGFIAGLIQQHFPGVSISGCDGAPEAVEIAQKRFPEIEFRVGNIYSLPYADKEFDLAICTEVLEHLEAPDKAVRQLCRVAKSVLITVPHEPWFRLGNVLSLHNLSRLGDPIDHVQHWSWLGFQSFINSQISPRQVRFDRSFPWSIAIIEET